LFEYVASVAPRRTLAWDCATGNGQAAVPLAGFFESVIATDASSEQLKEAEPHPRVTYRLATASSSGIPAESVDLVTVAQALHWFDLPEFYAETRRVLAPGGAIAIWGYGDPVLDEPELQRRLHEFNRGKMEPYWSANRDILLDRYQTIPFPFDEIQPPAFELRKQWTLEELGGYLRTWSATGKFVERHGNDPVVEIEAALGEMWGGESRTRIVTWPLYLRVGYSNRLG
jgi:SAM-dependent methyltransferase